MMESESKKQKGRKGEARPKHWFTTNKHMCKCQDFNLADIPQLVRLLPENYDYKLCDFSTYDGEEKFNITLRISLSTVEEMTVWKQLYEERSLTSHVVDRTFPKASAARVFKRYYRCKYGSVRKKQSTQGSSLGCPAVMSITIRSWGWSKASKVPDPHLETHPTQVRIRFAHNHPLDTPEMLSKRELCPEILKRFEEMFRQGMKPKDALEKHKWDLHQQLGPEKYLAVAIDGFYMPKRGRLKKMYQTISGESSVKSLSKRVSKHNPDADRLAFEQCVSRFAEDLSVDYSNVQEDGNVEAADTDDHVDSVTGSTSEATEDKASSEQLSGLSKEALKSSNRSLSFTPEVSVDSEKLTSSKKDTFDALVTSQSQGHGQSRQSTLFPVSSAPVLTLQNMESLSFDSSNSKLCHGRASTGAQAESQVSTFQDVGGGTTLSELHDRAPLSSSLSTQGEVQQRHKTLATDGAVEMIPPTGAAQSSQVTTSIHSNISHHPQPYPQLDSGSVHTHNLNIAHPHSFPADFSSLNFPNYYSHHHSQPSTSHCFYTQTIMGHSSTSQNVLSHFTPGSFTPTHLASANSLHTQSAQSKTLPTDPSVNNSNLSLHPQAQNWQYLSKVKQSSHSIEKASAKGRLTLKRKATHMSSSTSLSKKIVPKRNPINLYNAKRFRASLLKEKSPILNTNTHQQVSTALQNILLADKAKMVKERLSKFCSLMEEKLTSDGKTYVPAVAKFLDTWESLLGEEDLTRAMKEFGKSPQTVIEEYELRKREKLRDKRVQTQTSCSDQSNRKPEPATTVLCNKKVQTIAPSTQCSATQVSTMACTKARDKPKRIKKETVANSGTTPQRRDEPLTSHVYVGRGASVHKADAPHALSESDAVSPSIAQIRQECGFSSRSRPPREATSSIHDYVSSTVLLRVQNSIKNKSMGNYDAEPTVGVECCRQSKTSNSFNHAVSSKVLRPVQSASKEKSLMNSDTQIGANGLLLQVSQTPTVEHADEMDESTIMSDGETYTLSPLSASLGNASSCHDSLPDPAVSFMSPNITMTSSGRSRVQSALGLQSKSNVVTSLPHGSGQALNDSCSSPISDFAPPTQTSSAHNNSSQVSKASHSSMVTTTTSPLVVANPTSDLHHTENSLPNLAPKEEPLSPSKHSRGGKNTEMDILKCSSRRLCNTRSGRAMENSVEGSRRLVVLLRRISNVDMPG